MSYKIPGCNGGWGFGQMKYIYEIPDTLTDAQKKSGYTIIIQSANYAESTSRIIPYSEIYSSRNSIMETPIERFQRAAEEDKLQKTKS